MGRKVGGSHRAPRQPLRVKGFQSSCRAPHLFAALLSVTAPAPRHGSPAAQPSGADAGDARTRVRARSRESAPFRVNLRGGCPRPQLRGWGPAAQTWAVSARQSPPSAARRPEPARSTQARRVSRLQVVPASGMRRQEMSASAVGMERTDTRGWSPLTEAPGAGEGRPGQLGCSRHMRTGSQTLLGVPLSCTP